METLLEQPLESVTITKFQSDCLTTLVKLPGPSRHKYAAYPAGAIKTMLSPSQNTGVAFEFEVSVLEARRTRFKRRSRNKRFRNH